MTLLTTFLRRRIPLRSWSWYLWEKTLRKWRQKLNSCHRAMATMMTMTTIMRKKKTTRLKKKKAMRLKMKTMRVTLP
jgi:hypothetical protein